MIYFSENTSSIFNKEPNFMTEVETIPKCGKNEELYIDKNSGLIGVKPINNVLIEQPETDFKRTLKNIVNSI